MQQSNAAAQFINQLHGSERTKVAGGRLCRFMPYWDELPVGQLFNNLASQTHLAAAVNVGHIGPNWETKFLSVSDYLGGTGHHFLSVTDGQVTYLTKDSPDGQIVIESEAEVDMVKIEAMVKAIMNDPDYVHVIR